MHPEQHCNLPLCGWWAVTGWSRSWTRSAASGRCAVLFMVGAHGTLRYGELRKLLDGVTHKMLSNQLKELAADGWCSASTTTRSRPGSSTA